MVMRALLLLALIACQGKDDARQRQAPTKSDAAVVEVPVDASELDPDALAAAEPEPPDPGKQLDDLGAVPAWQAVIDRSRYLARRNQKGVVYGTLRDVVTATVPDAGVQQTAYTWLSDDTEGNGALSIKVSLGARAKDVKAGDRVALAGSWVLDDDRTYFWNVEELTKLPPAPPPTSKDPPSAPGHDIQEAPLPPGSRTVSVARDNDIIYFMVVGRPPAIDGEGWPVGDANGTPISAYLNLPGERPSFGAQDFRTPDERWKLKRSTVYWVRIGKVRRPNGPDKPAYINAVSAPVKMK